MDILESANIKRWLTPADHVVARLPNEVYLEYSEAIPMAATKFAAANVAVLISICADTVIPLTRGSCSCARRNGIQVMFGIKLIALADASSAEETVAPATSKAAQRHGWHEKR